MIVNTSEIKQTNDRAKLAKRPFVVNHTFVKFDRNIPNLGKICPNIVVKFTHTLEYMYLSYLLKFCQILGKFNLDFVNFDQIWQT